MKTKITKLVAFTALLALCGCDGGWNAALCRQAVLEEFKATEIQTLPGEDFKFIVRKPDGSIWYAEALTTRAECSAKVLLFPAR